MRRSSSPAILIAVLASLLGGAALGDSAAAAGQGSAVSAHAAIVGGAPVRAGAFPSIVQVIDSHGHGMFGKCTGTVIAPKLILTAGHCAENMRTGTVNAAAGYSVLTGLVDMESEEGQISSVSAVIPYEGFSRRFDDGDAALLVLSTPTAAPAVGLATPADAGRFPAGVTATIAGWGKTSYSQPLPSARLREASTVLQRSRVCALAAPPFFSREELCAVDPPSFATGACFGDSGGPLLGTNAAGEVLEIGIAIHGYDKCSPRRPTVFTRVESIEAWAQRWIDAYAPAPAAQPPPAIMLGDAVVR